ncbi:hypothetical protein AB4Z40_08655 [Bosea sp. 2YAB26]|uniref:hypothetical protein n=1 Tax=Bosea sp. 2YAB26 TaxID=3237478 RepID=UPI003F9023AE
MTELTPRESRIHSAVRELIDEAGGCEAAAKVLDLKKSQVGRMRVSPPEAFMNVFQKNRLEAFVGRPIVTAAEASILGHELVPQIDPAAKGTCIHASIGSVMGEAADLAKTYSELVADGLSQTDAALIENELRDAARAVEHARQACAAIRTKRNA